MELGVETAEWCPLKPAALGQVPRGFFVDGVRRIEHRLLIESGDRTVFGLLGSAGVGATEAGNRARVVETRIRRLALVGGGLSVGPFEAPLGNGAGSIVFEPEVLPESTPDAPLQVLQNAMRRAEAALASDLSGDGSLVFLDGPLSFLEPLDRPIVGFVKRPLRSYLPAEAAKLEYIKFYTSKDYMAAFFGEMAGGDAMNPEPMVRTDLSLKDFGLPEEYAACWRKPW